METQGVSPRGFAVQPVSEGCPQHHDVPRWSQGRRSWVNSRVRSRPWARQIMAARLVDVGDARLELLDWGSGEPVVFVQTALTADELLPLAMDPALEAGYRKILYHRRGYAGSSSVDGSGSITRDAADCRALMAALSVDRAHIVGYSYSGAVGLQVAADAPASTHSLILVEPPPVHTPCAKEFRAANDRLLRT